MNCHDVRQHWMLYLDSEGDSELHFRINEHLGMCPACAAWMARQQRFEQALADRLAAGAATAELWQRVLRRAGVRAPVNRWRPRFALVAALAAAILLAVGIGLRIAGPAHSSDLDNVASDWHEQLLLGNVRPDLVSTSDQEVDHYLKKRVPFRVHCPPRTTDNFAVQGAGVCTLKDGQQAAYIVGRVEQAPVTILVLDRASLDAFPNANAHLQGGKHHHCREGNYAMVSGIIADNVVLVIGTAPPESLEKLLNAYGSYPEDEV
jgi:anti-sigma factor RsiW